MKDETTMSITWQAAPDPPAVPGRTAVREFRSAGELAADRTVPIAVPVLTAPPVSAVPAEPLDIRRAPRRRASSLSALLVMLVSGGLLAFSGWLIFGVARPAANVASGGNTAASTQALTGGQAAASSQQLLTRMPASFAATCQPIAVPAVNVSLGADAEVVCQPGALGGGGSVQYAHFRKPGAMQSAYASLTHGLPQGDCLSAAGYESYWQGSSPQPAGDLGCFVNDTGQRVFLWTDNRLAILSIAASKSMTFAGLNQWWQGDSGPEPTPRGAG